MDCYISLIFHGAVFLIPSEVLKMDQKISVVVLDFDDEKKRISLGLKQLTPHPWDVLPENIVEGNVVKGKVVNIEDYGAFLEIMPGVEGLVHVSEITWANTPINAKEFFKLGDEHEAKIVTLDKESRKMSLSIKQLSPDPWNDIETKFAEGSRHTGLVKNITNYGVFVELAPGIGGMIHISDLSWLKRFNHPGEYTKVGANIDVVIMGIDKENRKLQLGHKQLEEDPWNTLQDTFAIGSIHEGTVSVGMIKALWFNCLMDWKDLLLTVILPKKTGKVSVQMKQHSLWSSSLTAMKRGSCCRIPVSGNKGK